MKVVCENIAKRYGDFYAVNHLNLTIEHGSLHFLLGPSGCGKTTILRLLAGLESPSSGRVWFDDRDVTHLHPAQRGCSIVFQNYALWPHMNVRQHIEYGLRSLKLARPLWAGRLEELLALTHLSAVSEHVPGQLSGGQQQRVALARALSINPSVLLLDEPLSHLDARLRHEMRDTICRIHDQTGLTTLYVTHDQKEALSMASAVSAMVAGEVVQTGAPRTLYQRPQSTVVASLIGDINMIDGVVMDHRGDVMLLQTALGVIASTNYAQPFHLADEVTVSFRPEALRSTTGVAAGGQNTFCLTIDRLIFLGEGEQVWLKGDDGLSVKGHCVHTGADHRIGQRLLCSLSPSEVLVLPRHAITSTATATGIKF